MLVKCKICGNKIDRADAYNVTVNGKNNYYCNEKEYSSWKIKKDVRDNTYSVIYDIFGRKVTNTVLFKEIGDLADIYTYGKIEDYLLANKTYLSTVMEKSFVSEYAQIRYFDAILKNSLADFCIEVKDYTKEIEIEIPTMKFTRNKKRKPLLEYESEEEDEEL